MLSQKSRKDHQDHKEFHIKRINGYLHKMVPIFDSTGKVMHYAMKPLMVELHWRDIMQIIVGSVLLAIPVGFTEEVWRLSEELPPANIMLFSALSLVFIAVFVYYNFYRNHLRGYEIEFLKRVIAIYLISGLVVAVFLTLIGQCDWGSEGYLALKRVILVSFPASMSATLSDTIK